MIVWWLGADQITITVQFSFKNLISSAPATVPLGSFGT